MNLNNKTSKKAVAGNIESECKKELTEIEKKFREGDKKQYERMKDYSDSNFYTCVVFQTKEQAMEFNRIFGFNPDKKYINGNELARKLKIELKNATPPIQEYKKDKKFLEFVD